MKTSKATVTVVGVLAAIALFVAGYQMLSIYTENGQTIMEVFYRAMGWATCGLGGLVAAAVYAFDIILDRLEKGNALHEDLLAKTK